MKELLITSLLGIAVLALDIVKIRKAILPVIVLGFLATIASCVMDWGMNENPFNNNMLIMDNFALGFIAVLSIVAMFWFLISSDYFVNDVSRTDLYALAVFSFCGAMVLSAYSNLVMLFIGIEILSIPMYVLATSNKKSLTSNEAGFKYFFLGALASAILLFGIALIYGATGSFDMAAISAHISDSGTGTIMTAGILMIMIGFFFKVSIAPFHMWTPDVYQGSPTVITALMSTVVKGAAFAAMFRFFYLGFSSSLEYTSTIFAVTAALTLIVSNVMAVLQTNTKRLLAYSSISHAAFMLGAVMTASSTNPRILMYYILVYSIASLTSFTVLYQVSKIQNGAEGFDAFKGLVRRSPLMAGAMTLSLLSMAGIPPLAGFMAKYFVISAVLDAGYTWLVILMILSSAVAVYYYLRFIVAIFTPIENAGRIVLNDIQRIVMIIFTVALVALFFLAAFV
jgi:NADH-quinone oxidoreductase subunit N